MLKMNPTMLLEMKNVWELLMDKPTMLDALETGPEIEMMMLEWDSFAKNNLVSDDSIFYTCSAANKIEPRWVLLF